MILRRLATAIHEQNWFTVFIEFTLIVIGLLFALQIDSWNQDRIDRQDERYYLARILDDIDESLDRNESDLAFMRKKVDVSLWVVGKLRAGKLEEGEDELFRKRFLQVQNWRTGGFIDSTIDELRTSGRMTIIQSREFREQLGRFELKLESHRRAQTNIADFMKNIENEVTPRIDRPVVSGDRVLSAPYTDLASEESLQTLLSSFEELAADVVLVRYLDAYTNFYLWRTLNISTLQENLRELRAYTVEALEHAES